MEVFYDFKPGLIKESALALGFFDGVHPGHRVVISKALEEAKRLNVKPTVVTFKDHPRTLTTGSAPLLLTLAEQRLELFEELGIEAALVLTFSERICRMTPREYVQNVLVDCLGALSVSVGINHRFGRNREGNPELLAKLGEEFGFVVHAAPMVTSADDGERLEVSSSAIRQSIAEGNMDLAERLLTRPYTVLGTVVRGDGRGRQLGFPTANIKVSPVQMLPPRGVYSGYYRHGQDRHPAVINIGYRPTVLDESPLTVEVHILDFDQDLYDKTISVEFCQRLRDEKKFAGIAELKEQIALDCQMAHSQCK